MQQHRHTYRLEYQFPTGLSRGPMPRLMICASQYAVSQRQLDLGQFPDISPYPPNQPTQPMGLTTTCTTVERNGLTHYEPPTRSLPKGISQQTIQVVRCIGSRRKIPAPQIRKALLLFHSITYV
ncbi:hypothetical protein GOODEAATRI_029600 [Goodea atripinnis]|uniref:Uncharacterized protein n=1 Tax=Goodea atripinnis TaxID=208336 RepID=A0ABV0MZB7_9TELE